MSIVNYVCKLCVCAMNAFRQRGHLSSPSRERERERERFRQREYLSSPSGSPSMFLTAKDGA